MSRLEVGPKKLDHELEYNGADHQVEGGAVQLSRNGVGIGRPATTVRMHPVFPYRGPMNGTRHGRNCETQSA